MNKFLKVIDVIADVAEITPIPYVALAGKVINAIVEDKTTPTQDYLKDLNNTQLEDLILSAQRELTKYENR